MIKSSWYYIRQWVRFQQIFATTVGLAAKRTTVVSVGSRQEAANRQLSSATVVVLVPRRTTAASATSGWAATKLQLSFATVAALAPRRTTASNVENTPDDVHLICLHPFLSSEGAKGWAGG